MGKEYRNYNKILKLLLCPACGMDLETGTTDLRCSNCRKNYFMKDGIPSFLPDEKQYWQKYFSEKVKTAPDYAKAVGYSGKRNFDLVYSAVKNILGKTSGKNILDVGCGHGIMSRWLSGENTVIGVDAAIDMLNIAGKNNLIPIHADGMNLPFRKDVFDLIIAVEIIPHIENGEEFVKYLAGFAKRKGKILITGLSSHSILRKTYRTIKKLSNPGYFKKPIPKLWDPITLANSLKSRDFAVDIFYTCFPTKKIIQERNELFKRHILGSNFFILAQKC